MLELASLTVSEMSFTSAAQQLDKKIALKEIVGNRLAGRDTTMLSRCSLENFEI